MRTYMYIGASFPYSEGQENQEKCTRHVFTQAKHSCANNTAGNVSYKVPAIFAPADPFVIRIIIRCVTRCEAKRLCGTQILSTPDSLVDLFIFYARFSTSFMRDELNEINFLKYPSTRNCKSFVSRMENASSNERGKRYQCKRKASSPSKERNRAFLRATEMERLRCPL